MTATSKHLEATNKHLKWSSEINTMLILKLLKGKTRWESTRMGDELSVTYTIEIKGIKYIGKVTATDFSKYEGCQEEGINTVKLEARVILYKK